MMLNKDYSLARHNTFGMDVHASAWAEFASEEALRALLLSPDFVPWRERFLVIGSGSNLLFCGDYDGLVLHSAIRGIHVVEETADDVLVCAGSGVICLNGAAARLVQPGDLVIIVAYATMSEDEAKSWKPTVIHVNAKNEIV